jgi:hypothetical protein
MSLLNLCEIIFFLGFGLNHFYPNRNLTIVVAVVAIVIGVILLLTGPLGLRLN